MRSAAGIICLLLSPLVFAGSWGTGSFENDDAQDWLIECSQSRGAASLVRAFDAVLKNKYIEAPEASAAIAAAEVVAAAIGKPSARFPKELKTWMQDQNLDQIVRLAPSARKVLQLVQDPKLSELQQLQQEANLKEWHTEMAELAGRLGK